MQNIIKAIRPGISSCSVLALAVLAGCSSKLPSVVQGYIEGEYVYVASPIGGALTNLAVARGDEVKAGQLLFTLEKESEAAAVRQAQENLAQAKSQLANLTKGQRPSEIASLQAQLERAKANFQLATDEFHRRKRLREGGAEVISVEELDKARAQRDADQAQVDQLIANLETAKLGAREDEINAAKANVASKSAALDKAQWAFDQKQQFALAGAQVHDTLYREGEWVAASNPVVVLLPPGNIKVRFFMPQEKLPSIKPSQTVRVTFDGAAHAYDATVNYISTQAEFTPPVIYSRDNRAKLVYMIEAKFLLKDAADLRPGQPVDVHLASGQS
jgi:HlyD family secretion protein